MHSAVLGWTVLCTQFSWFTNVVQVFCISPNFLFVVSKTGILKSFQV